MNTTKLSKQSTSLRFGCLAHRFTACTSYFSKISHWTITFSFFLSLTVTASAQDYSRTINRSASFEKSGIIDNTLSIYNINGSVSVEGYDADNILITAIQKINGTDEEVELAKEELNLRVEEKGNRVLIYINAPFITLNRNGNRIGYRIDRWDEDYKFLFDITVRVPKNTQIYASSINNGSVKVDKITRKVTASNVNGRIELKNISGATEAHTINGDITATYIASPDSDSHYKTLNGTIEVNYPENLSADIRFKSMHGDLYTDFTNTKRLHPQVSKDISRKRGETVYRIDRFAPLRIGAGGPTYSFEVLNGNVFIKQIKIKS